MNTPLFELQFAAAMAVRGMQPTEIVADGKLHRFDAPDDKRGKRSAWYVLHGDGMPAGSFGNWRIGSSETWCAKPDYAMTDVERHAHHQRIKQAKAEAAAERSKVANEAAARCEELWNRAHTIAGGHPYIERKGINPFAAKQWRDALLIPLRDANGNLRSLQFITPNGNKRFKTGGNVAGCYCTLDGTSVQDAPLLICEGWATACSLHEATGFPVAAAMNAGNLLAVAQTLRAERPNVPMIVCADDDMETDGNPGLTKAKEAAQAVGAMLAVPQFGSDRPDGATDFNDLHVACGAAAVAACVEAARREQPIVKTKASPTAEAAPMNGDAASDETDEQTIERLAALTPIQYDRVRKAESKRMGLQVQTLDRLVRAVKGEAASEANTPFAEVDPWHAPVDGAALLSEIAKTVRRFVVCQPETAHATALWVAMTWCIDVVDVAPIAAITAPEKRCGKSQLLFLIGRLANRPLTASNITPAALFRSIDLWHPTLLIDEADAFMRENEELRGLLNCGHTRESAYTVRVVGDDHTPKMFFVWGAKAIAGIGQLADTLMDRSIGLELRRKMPDEHVEKLRHAEPGLFDDLRAKLARWSQDNAAAIRMARPSLPNALHDRAADNWEPLFQIAEVAGEHWPILATSAALKLSGENEAAQSAGAELLMDIKDVFDRLKARRISMSDLLLALCEDDEAPWKTWNHGRPMNPRQLGKKLKEYGIKSGTVNIGYDRPKGFKVEQFEDAFARYLSSSPVSTIPSVTQSQLNIDADFKVTIGQSSDQAKELQSPRKPTPVLESDQVSDEAGKPAGEEVIVPDVEAEDEL